MNGGQRWLVSRPCGRQRGAVAVVAVLLLVLLALVGAYVMSSAQVQHLTTALSWQGMQAWFAARSGLEWAMQRATSSQAAHDAICSAGPTVTGFNLVLAGHSYALQISCDDRGGFGEAGASYEVDAIEVEASTGTPGQLGYARRVVQATVTRGQALP